MPAKKKQRRKSSPLIPFTDNKGHTVHLRENLTIGQLTRMGIKIDVGSIPKPWPNGLYVHTPK